MDLASISLLKDGLDTFLIWSGLRPNNNKSKIFLAGGSADLRSEILLTLGFLEGKLPMHYMGVPIIS